MSEYADGIFAASNTTPLRGVRRLEPDEKPRVLLFGTPHLRQCLHYRINQKIEHLEAAGYDVLFVSQDEPEVFIQQAPYYDVAIIYRIPAFPRFRQAIEYARARGMTVFYEIDDLIFDPAFFPDSFESYGNQLKPREYANLVVDTPLFRLAMSLCDYGIASTPSLQREVAKVVRSGICFLHRNAFDARHERFAALYNPTIRPPRDTTKQLTIFYGTATKAHNEDFDTLAAPALASVLGRHANVRFVVAGYLTVPQVLKPFEDRIVRLPPIWDLDAYWSVLAGVDINMAVLKHGLVSDCKSEIKWLEAAMVGVPSIVSRTATYAEVLTDGETVLFAETAEDWTVALERLVVDPELRTRVGHRAYAKAVADYGTEAMASNIDRIVEQAHPRPTIRKAARRIGQRVLSSPAHRRRDARPQG